MPDVIFNSFKKELLEADIDLLVDTIKVMLVTSGYMPNQDTHDFIDDVSSNEVSGTGYSAGGETLASKTVTQDDTDDEGVFDADDVTWADSTITARGAVLYKDTGTPSTSPVICYADFTEDKTSENGDFLITWNAEGILNLG